MRKPLHILLALLGSVSCPAAAPESPRLNRGAGIDGPGSPARQWKRRVQARRHLLLAYPTPPDREKVAALRSRGIHVTRAVSSHVLAVSVPDGMAPAGLGALSVSGIEAAGKLSPLLAADPGTACLVEFHSDVDRKVAQDLIEENGFLILEHPDLLPYQFLVAGGADRMVELAEWDEVAYIFPASAGLVSGERMTACSGALTDAGVLAQYVRFGAGWGPGPIGYFFESLTGKLERSTVESEIVRALSEWSRYAPLDFVPSQTAADRRTISILFARGEHGDGVPFDGPGRVLAHTYYPSPPNPEPIAGNMHLDADEPWRLAGTTDLFTVALHEAGHALGLGHSDRPGSVMYPYYRQASGLTADDIAGIRELYGSREQPPPPEPPGPAEPPASGITVSISQPSGTALITTAAAITVSGRAVGGAGALRVAWRTDRGADGTASGGASWSAPMVPLAPGANTITITATDQAGHSGSVAVSMTRVQEDIGTPTPSPGSSAAPSLKITSPGFTILSTSLAAVELRGTASASAVSITWTNSTGGSGTAAGTSSWNAEVPLRKGTNMITVRAYGPAGASSWRSLTVVRR